MTDQKIDPNAIKQQQRKDWGEAAPSWRQNYDRFREVTAPVAEKMLDLAAIASGHRVLDIACGSGEPAIPAARRVGDTGFVLATDMAPEMLDVARDNAAAQGLKNMEFQLVDGEELDVPPESFDAVTCRWGLMFMPEPVRCLRQAYNALKPGDRAVFAVWGPPDRNPFIALPTGIARKYYEGPPLPDPTGVGGVFSFADKSKLAFVFEQAGFQGFRAEEMDVPMSVFASGVEYWEWCREFLGPLRRLLDGMPAKTQKKIAEEVTAAAGGGDPNGKVSLNGNPILGSATK
jgi:ubiquinone/menaquinone biosynthesis C-methylase UbiE